MLRTIDREFAYVATAVTDVHHRHRYVVKHRITKRPSVAGCLYAAHLVGVHESPNTVATTLKGLRALLSFSDESELDIERRLLQGERIEPRNIRAFAHWLEQRYRGNGDVLPKASRSTFNAILMHARNAESWFISMYWSGNQPQARGHEISGVLATQRAVWCNVQKRVICTPTAPDLDEDEIRRIDTFLSNLALPPDADHMWVRTFLIWRLAIEFGLRIGEILALRIEDCPTRQRSSFEIVRIEDRRQADSRGVYTPRPKTLGRSLGILLANSAFPALVFRYISEYRVTWKVRPDGSRRKSPNVPHPYLLVTDAGDPLPQVTARSLAAKIARETGVAFNWHAARHAFFNRAYAAIGWIPDLGEQNVRLNDLIYWGGWSSPKSLEIYTNRARKHRAAHALAIWQGRLEEWKSLR